MNEFEEFKEWINELYKDTDGIPIMKMLIKDFEKEQAEKENEKRIKRILFRNLDKFHFKSGSLNPHNQQVMRMNFVNSVCNELKEKGYLK